MPSFNSHFRPRRLSLESLEQRAMMTGECSDPADGAVDAEGGGAGGEVRTMDEATPLDQSAFDHSAVNEPRATAGNRNRLSDPPQRGADEVLPLPPSDDELFLNDPAPELEPDLVDRILAKFRNSSPAPLMGSAGMFFRVDQVPVEEFEISPKGKGLILLPDPLLTPLTVPPINVPPLDSPLPDPLNPPRLPGTFGPEDPGETGEAETDNASSVQIPSDLLDNIPYVSRLFRNTGIHRESSSLTLMVTPRIIIQEEEG